MAEVSLVSIGYAVSGPRDVVSDDYNLIPDGVDDEDYNTATGGEDFGADPLNYLNHNLSIIGTLDGQTVFIQEEPKLSFLKKAARYYASSVPGLWHSLAQFGRAHVCTADTNAPTGCRLLL